MGYLSAIKQHGLSANTNQLIIEGDCSKLGFHTIAEFQSEYGLEYE